MPLPGKSTLTRLWKHTPFSGKQPLPLPLLPQNVDTNEQGEDLLQFPRTSGEAAASALPSPLDATLSPPPLYSPPPPFSGSQVEPSVNVAGSSRHSRQRPEILRIVMGENRREVAVVPVDDGQSEGDSHSESDSSNGRSLLFSRDQHGEEEEDNEDDNEEMNMEPGIIMIATREAANQSRRSVSNRSRRSIAHSATAEQRLGAALRTGFIELPFNPDSAAEDAEDRQEIEALERRLRAQEEEMSAMKQQISLLQHKNSTLEVALEESQGNVGQCERWIRMLVRRVESLEDRLSGKDIPGSVKS